LQQSQLPLLMPKRLVALGHQCFGGEYAIPTYHVKLERWDENQDRECRPADLPELLRAAG
jgi:hypothetical protein